ncbi:hypothetical protein [Gracilimonas tropica]|uniref:hypothetical protein n=1 Tax=Gracilimonas tropica TaxID=454600 RepID=UPI00037A96D2|nr:hypothetical protein [Gracilimonas tropica]
MKSLKALLIVGVVLLFILLIFRLDSGTVFSFLLGDPVKTPVTKFGEFPVELTYSISGEKLSTKDTVICEYKGIECNEAGCFRDWDFSLKSGKTDLVLKQISADSIIYYPTGSCFYYMNDFPHGGSYKHAFPNAALFTKNGSLTTKASLDSLKLAEKFEIHLNSWEYETPLSKNEIFNSK